MMVDLTGRADLMCPDVPVSAPPIQVLTSAGDTADHTRVERTLWKNGRRLASGVLAIRAMDEMVDRLGF